MGLIRQAAVYHRRRQDFAKFRRQVYVFGMSRITLKLLYPGSLKLVHTPAHLHHRPPLQPRSEQYGNQFGRSERSRAVGPGFLARPVVIGKIAYELRAAHSCLF